MYYEDSLRELLFTRHSTLWDLDLASFNWVNAKLGNSIKAGFSESFEKQPGEGTIDCRNRLLPANRETFRLEPYQQVFGSSFQTNLSVLDLLFNLGPQSREYLMRQMVEL